MLSIYDSLVMIAKYWGVVFSIDNEVCKVGDLSRGRREGSHFQYLLHRGVGKGATPFP